MLRINYEYIESELAPYLSFISKCFGIGYAFLGLFGISAILRMGEWLMGLGIIAGAIVLFLISVLYNKMVEKRIQNIIDNHPEKCIELAYNREIRELTDRFSKKEITEAEFSREKEYLKSEMVSEIRKYKPDYNYGDTIRV